MKSVDDRSANVGLLITDFRNTFATSRQLKSVAASLLCMLKRLATTDFVQQPIADLAATFVKPCHDLCNLSAIVNFFSPGKVTVRSQALWARGFMFIFYCIEC